MPASEKQKLTDALKSLEELMKDKLQEDALNVDTAEG